MIPDAPTAPGNGSAHDGVKALLIAGTLVLITLIVTSGVVVAKFGQVSRTVAGPAASGSDAPSGDSARSGDIESPRSTAGTGEEEETQDEWVAEVNAYCRAIDRQLKQIPVEGDNLPQYREKSAVLRTLTRELRSRSVPEEHRRTYDRMLDAWDKSAAYLLGIASAIENYATQQMYDYERKRADANGRGNLLAHELDLDDCASAGGLPDDG